MTKPVLPDSRKRRPWRWLSSEPGTLWNLVPQFAADHRYGPGTVRNIRSATCGFKDLLSHEPVPADFSTANIDDLRNAMRAKYSSRCNISNSIAILKRLWLWCATRELASMPPEAYKPKGGPGNGEGHVWNPDPNGNSVKLSDAEGTLWHVCSTVYFPRAIRITGDATRSHYRNAIKWFKLSLGHEPTIADLTDDNVILMMQKMRHRGRAAETINGTAGCLKTLWTWLAKRRIVEEFPTVQNVKEPKRVPRAWSREDLNRLLAACAKARGFVGPCRASDWWTAIHLVLWDTGERIGATLAIRKDWIDWQTAELLIPAEARKGQESDMSYKLHADTLKALERIRGNGSDLLFGGVKLARLYSRYKRIRTAAGLPINRQSAFHRMRRSVASHLHAGGHNATDALGHGSADVTRKSYLDPALCGAVRPADVLFRPNRSTIESMAVIAVEVPAEEARKLPRAKLLTTGKAVAQ